MDMPQRNVVEAAVNLTGGGLSLKGGGKFRIIPHISAPGATR